MNSKIYSSPKNLPPKCLTLAQTFQNLLDSGQNSDVVFKINDQDIRAHKLIVSTRAPKLGAMLKESPSTEDYIQITDCKPEDFKCFLTFLYTDDCCISSANVEQLTDIAIKWDVKPLIRKCMTFMENQIDVPSILRYATIGYGHRNEYNLYQKCVNMLPDLLPDINFIVNNGSKWVPISYELLLDIVQNCNYIDGLEETLFYKILHWAKKECEHRKLSVTAHNIRLALGNITEYINYNLLSPETLATVVYKYQFLSSELLLECFCKLAIEEEANIQGSITAAV
uniref:BTB domain-containing protein n=1 Tax=Panagrolaimus davidi TaxID=227884 RepID=A0A914PKN8_9BILA